MSNRATLNNAPVDSHFSHAFPLNRRDLLFNGEKLVLEKLESSLIFIIFLRENKIRNYNPKKNDSLNLEKQVFEKPESWFKDQVTYWEGTWKR